MQTGTHRTASAKRYSQAAPQSPCISELPSVATVLVTHSEYLSQLSGTKATTTQPFSNRLEKATVTLGALNNLDDQRLFSAATLQKDPAVAFHLYTNMAAASVLSSGYSMTPVFLSCAAECLCMLERYEDAWTYLMSISETDLAALPARPIYYMNFANVAAHRGDWPNELKYARLYWDCCSEEQDLGMPAMRLVTALLNSEKYEEAAQFVDWLHNESGLSIGSDGYYDSILNTVNRKLVDPKMPKPLPDTSWTTWAHGGDWSRDGP